MARKLSSTEFYELVARNIDTSNERAQFIWEQILDVILKELMMYNTITVPLLGVFKTCLKDGRMLHVPNSKQDKIKLNTDAPTRTIFIEPYMQLNFTVSETFKKIIKDKQLSKADVHRAKSELKRQEEMILEQERQVQKLKNKQNAMNRVREERLQRIHKQKELQKMSNKKRNEILKQEKEQKEREDYGY